MSKIIFKYMTGEEIIAGDRIGDITNEEAMTKGKVEIVIQPESEEAEQYSCYETGGVLTSFEDGDCILWVEKDHDLVFLGRCLS